MALLRCSVRRSLSADLRQGLFYMTYGEASCRSLGVDLRAHGREAFGAFPPRRVFVSGLVDLQGLQAPRPVDPRQVTPSPSPLAGGPVETGRGAHVVVAPCPLGHRLQGELRCLARQELDEGLEIAYAGWHARGITWLRLECIYWTGEVYEPVDHTKYSAKYSLEVGGGQIAITQLDRGRACGGWRRLLQRVRVARFASYYRLGELVA